jgi:hypothetical protein
MRCEREQLTSISKANDGQFSSYDAVANEYYDPTRHPTCANFRELSRVYISPHLLSRVEQGFIVEVGAGRSMVAELLSTTHSLNSVILTDQSAAMLSHSAPWALHGAQLLLADATRIDTLVPRAHTLVASLADPYNEPTFWEAAFRTLEIGGVVICTLPSYEWASSFRNERGDALTEARFVSADGKAHVMRSLIPQLADQVRMIAQAGLTLINYEALGTERLDCHSNVSPKLVIRDRLPVLWGMCARRPV